VDKSNDRKIIEAKEFEVAVSLIAQDIDRECNSGSLHQHDRRVVVVRGLRAALDAAAKKPGYRSMVKVLVDVLFAELMLRHGLVVVQACHLSNDLEMIVKEFAMSCYLHHLLAEPVH
jgi:hypothetical protein